MKMSEIKTLREITNKMVEDNKEKHELQGVIAWLKKHRAKRGPNEPYIIEEDDITDDGKTIRIKFKCDISEQELTEIPFKIDIASRDFIAIDNKLTSFKNFPEKVGSSLDVRNNHITSLEGCPKEIGEDFNLGMQHGGLTSLKDFHKHVEYISGHLWIAGIKSHVLGILLMEYPPEEVHCEDTSDAKLIKVCEILTKHLTQNIAKKKVAILNAQAELIEHDLEEYAEL